MWVWQCIWLVVCAAVAAALLRTALEWLKVVFGRLRRRGQWRRQLVACGCSDDELKTVAQQFVELVFKFMSDNRQQLHNRLLRGEAESLILLRLLPDINLEIYYGCLESSWLRFFLNYNRKGYSRRVEIHRSENPEQLVMELFHRVRIPPSELLGVSEADLYRTVWPQGLPSSSSDAGDSSISRTDVVELISERGLSVAPRLLGGEEDKETQPIFYQN